MANRVGQQLGNYKLEKLLGEGGFAEVYLTLATQLQKLHDEMRQRQIQTLRQQAKDAQKAGDRVREETAWKALLQLYSYDSEARTRVSELSTEQRQLRIQALRQQVRDARQRGMQEQEIAFLKELLQF